MTHHHHHHHQHNNNHQATKHQNTRAPNVSHPLQQQYPHAPDTNNNDNDQQLHQSPPLCNSSSANTTSTSNSNPNSANRNGAADLMAGNNSQLGLVASSLPHQLSQLCNNQQYPLLALQQNFSHLLPQNYAAAAAAAAVAAAESHQHLGQHDSFQNTRTGQANSLSANNNYTNHQHLHQHFRNNNHSHTNIAHHNHQINLNASSIHYSSSSSNMSNSNNTSHITPASGPGATATSNGTSSGTSNSSSSNSNSSNNILANNQAINMKQQPRNNYNFIRHNQQLNNQLNLNSTSVSHRSSSNNFRHHHHHHHHHHHPHHHLFDSNSATNTSNNATNTTTSATSTNNSASSSHRLFNGHHLLGPEQQHNPTHHQRSHQNWRQSKSSTLNFPKRLDMTTQAGTPFSLLDLSAKVVAEHIPFQSIEQRYEHIPEPVQRRIIFWSFPRDEDDIKMYSSLCSDTSTNTTSSTSSTNAGQNTSSNNQSPSHANNAFAWIDNPAAAAAAVALATTSPAVTSLTKTSSNHARQLTFSKGQRLYHMDCVHDVLQVGFNLSGLINIRINPNNQFPTANSKVRGGSNNNSNSNLNSGAQNHGNDVVNNNLNQISDGLVSSSNDSDIRTYRVSVTFDRCKITSVSCSCGLQDIFWCEHVVALVLYRIRNPETIDLRVPISETLSSLDRQQLQKLVQYIIAEHHTEVLPTAQRLLDEMRQSFSEINRIQGAPDPTAGACTDDEHIWHLDESQVNEKVQNYLNLISSNSKEPSKHIHALFDKIREMFRARDSNGTRLLKLITEQFLQFATKNDKPRPLWDQLISLWVVVMLNPDLKKKEKDGFLTILREWSQMAKCPKEDVERRVGVKRKAAELSDDEDSEDVSLNSYNNDYSYNQSNNYPAHMATHRHRTFSSNNAFPVLKPFNMMPGLSTCPCQLPNSIFKKIKNNHQHSPELSSRTYSGASSSHHHNAPRNSSTASHHDARALAPQEPRSVFYRAIDFLDLSWDDPHLQLVLNQDGPIDCESPNKSSLFDYTGHPLWTESISQSAARVETLRSFGYREQALRLTVATVRRLKLYQDQWCMAITADSNIEPPCLSKSYESYNESWIGHPLDPINTLVDLLLDTSLNEASNSNSNPTSSLCTINSSRCSCPYNQALADFTHRLLPDLVSLSYQPQVDGFPILPLVNLATRRTPTSPTQNPDKTPYYHVPVPSCCQKDSYLTLAVEVALIALGQQRSVPTIGTAHERAIRQESELITKLESIDTTDPLLIEILKHQTTLLLEGGPFQNTCCGILTDSTPLHTFARYLFDSLVVHYPQLAYKVGVYALKMPLLIDENSENFGAARASPRSINHNYLQSEQLVLAQTMLSKAKDDTQQGGCLRKVYRASIKNIRNPAILLKLSKHALREAKPSVTTLYPALLRTSFDLGLQVLKITLSPHTSNGKTRKEATSFIVECATDSDLDAVIHLMKESREYFSAIEALSLVVAKDGQEQHPNLGSQALTKLKLRENPLREQELNRRSRELVLDCAVRDPTNCALEALKFCETDTESLKKALKIVMDAGNTGSMDSIQLIKVADHIHDRGMTDKAFDIALVAVDSLSIQPNSDTSSSKNIIMSACEYAQKVNGFATLIPKLISNIECATVLSEIYHRFCPFIPSKLGSYGNYIPSHRNLNQPKYTKDYSMGNNMNSLSSDIYQPRAWWDVLLKRTLKAFIDTTRSRLQNISPRHYQDFIKFLDTAQKTFDEANDGPQQFKDMISEIMKSYRTKKKLIEKLKARFDYPIKASI